MSSKKISVGTVKAAVAAGQPLRDIISVVTAVADEFASAAAKEDCGDAVLYYVSIGNRLRNAGVFVNPDNVRESQWEENK